MPKPLPRWDLKDLYKNPADPALKKDMARTTKQAQQFAQAYRGQIQQIAKTPPKLLAVIKKYEQLLQASAKPYYYAHLLFSTNSNPKNGAFMQHTQSHYVAIRQQLLFFELALAHLPPQHLKKLQREPLLKNYRHFLQRQFDYKPHRLSEAEEKLMSDKALTGKSAFMRLFEQETTSKQFTLKEGKTIKTVPQSHVLNLLHNPNREVRKNAAEALTRGLTEELTRATYIYNMLLQDKAIDDKYQRYATPDAARHLENEIDPTTVSTMANVVTKNFSVVHNYYRLKRKLLGVQKLYDYDRYAPLPVAHKKYSWPEAQQAVLAAYRSFSPKFETIARTFFDNRWIDAKPSLGKEGGAFCAYVTPDSHPLVLVNFHSSARDVSILAHELGHGIHAYLAREQTYLNYDWPLTIAETASVFGEMLLFDYFKQTITNKQELLALYVEKIENIFAAVFRQTAMYRFELDVHAARRTHGELSSTEINQFWLKHQRAMFGNSVTLTPGHAVWWSYIPHFIRTPFYVYAYAFGELLSLALYQQYKETGTVMVDAYLSFLRAGGSRSPAELVAALRVNINQRSFWEKGIAAIEQLVTEAKKLS